MVNLSLKTIVPEGARYCRIAFIAKNSENATYYLDNAYLGDPL